LPVASSHLILQTLSKEVLTPKSNSWSSEIASGSHFTASDVIPITDPLLAVSAAAGAFVHGLEDELMEVRSAAIGMDNARRIFNSMLTRSINCRTCPKVVGVRGRSASVTC